LLLRSIRHPFFFLLDANGPARLNSSSTSESISIGTGRIPAYQRVVDHSQSSALATSMRAVTNLHSIAFEFRHFPHYDPSHCRRIGINGLEGIGGGSALVGQSISEYDCQLRGGLTCIRAISCEGLGGMSPDNIALII